MLLSVIVLAGAKSRPKPTSSQVDSSRQKALGRHRAHELLDGARNDDPARIEETRARVVERLDDVLLERVVAQRLRHDHVDAVGRGHIGRMDLGDAAVGEPVVAQQLARDGGDVGPLVEVDALGAQLGRQEAQEAGARADVGHRRLALDDHAAQRLVKRGVADPVGEQRAVIFDAHGEGEWRIGRCE